MTDPVIVAAVIALIGGILSLAASIWVNRRLVKSELNKIKSEHTKIYATNLLERRLDAYSEMYNLVSECAKKIWYNKALEKDKFKTIFFEAIGELLREFSVLDSQYGLLLGADSSIKAYRMREAIRQAMLLDDVDKSELISTTEDVEKFVKHLGAFEMALKRDIGAYDVEDFERRPLIDNFWDLEKEILSPLKKAGETVRN